MGLLGSVNPTYWEAEGLCFSLLVACSPRLKACPTTPPSAPPIYIFPLGTHPLQTPPIMHPSQVVETRWLAHPSQAAETLAHASESSNWDAQTGTSESSSGHAQACASEVHPSQAADTSRLEHLSQTADTRRLAHLSHWQAAETLSGASYPYHFYHADSPDLSRRLKSRLFIPPIRLPVLGRTYGTYLHYERTYTTNVPIL